MAILCRASQTELAEGFARLGGVPDAKDIKPSEIGSIMVEARAGGTGQRFNAIEATVTRCIVQVGGALGVSYALGGDRARARLAAIADALLQDAHSGGTTFDSVKAVLIDPIAYRIESARREKSRKAAATRVEFFTMVRGEG